MAWAMWVQRPERVSAVRPARFPAEETSWQGKPPVRMSMGPCWSSACLHLILVMSPRLGVVG